MVGKVARAASAAVAADRNGLLQLHKCNVRGHIWGGAGAGHFGGHFLFQTERQGLEGLWGQPKARQVRKWKTKTVNEVNAKRMSEMAN